MSRYGRQGDGSGEQADGEKGGKILPAHLTAVFLPERKFRTSFPTKHSRGAVGVFWSLVPVPRG